MIFRSILGLVFFLSAGAASAQQFRALLFTKTDGWHHESINPAVTAMKRMAEDHYFTIDWHEDAARINDENLKQYDVIIFLLTTGNILNADQQAAMERFVRSGKGFVGIHSASDTEYDWPWYTQLIGRSFVIHPEIQTARIHVISRALSGYEKWPDALWWTDEWYEFGPEHVQGLRYTLTVDEGSYLPAADWGEKKGTGMGAFHPLAWFHEFDGGRSFYTALGHMPETYRKPLFLDHVFGGVLWAATGKGLDMRNDAVHEQEANL